MQAFRDVSSYPHYAGTDGVQLARLHQLKVPISGTLTGQRVVVRQRSLLVRLQLCRMRVDLHALLAPLQHCFSAVRRRRCGTRVACGLIKEIDL